MGTGVKEQPPARGEAPTPRIDPAEEAATPETAPAPAAPAEERPAHEPAREPESPRFASEVSETAGAMTSRHGSANVTEEPLFGAVGPGRRAGRRRARPSAAVAVAPWIAAAAVLVILGWAAVAFEQPILHAVPGLSGAYSAVGLPLPRAPGPQAPGSRALEHGGRR